MAGKNNLVWIAALIVLIAAGLFVSRDFIQKSVLSFGTDFTDSSGVDPAQFIVYRDESGFQVEYPLSMKADYPRTYGEIKIFFSATGENDTIELYQAGLSNSSVEALRAAIILQMDAATKSTLAEGRVGSARFMQFKAKNDLVSMFVQYALFQCPGGKTGFLTAFIPQDREGDLRVANYMASTFKCPE